MRTVVSKILSTLTGASILVVAVFLPTAAWSRTLATDDTAVIRSTGSTNLPGYDFTVSRDGVIDYNYFGNLSNFHGFQTGSTTIPTDVAKSFFNNISANYRSWQSSPYPYCAKNSFTSYIYIQYIGHTSPDLDCSTNDPDTQNLVGYVNSINDAVINDPPAVPNDPPAVPEPNTGLALLPFGALVVSRRLWHKKEQ